MGTAEENSLVSPVETIPILVQALQLLKDKKLIESYLL